MTEEMKLITALCEALGFSVEVKRDYNERVEKSCDHYNSFVDYPHTRGRHLKASGGMLDIDKDGNYTSKLIKPILSYKLIKGE